MSTWSLPSLLLGLHVMHGVMTGISTSPHATQAHQGFPMAVGRHTLILERKVDFRRLVPKKKHLKPHRLMKKMGKDFDSFWMSEEAPPDYLDIMTKRNVDASLQSKMTSLDLPHLAADMFEILQRGGNPSQNDTGTGNESSIDTNVTMATPPKNVSEESARLITGIVEGLESWLVRMGSCPVYYEWEDLGLLSWPRWIRKGMCSRLDVGNPIFQSDSESTPATPLSESSYCSWPPGMRCVPSKPKKIKILHWTCRYTKFTQWFNKFTQAEKKKFVNIGDLDVNIHNKHEKLNFEDHHSHRDDLVHHEDFDHLHQHHHNEDDDLDNNGDDDHDPDKYHSDSNSGKANATDADRFKNVEAHSQFKQLLSKTDGNEGGKNNKTDRNQGHGKKISKSSHRRHHRAKGHHSPNRDGDAKEGRKDSSTLGHKLSNSASQTQHRSGGKVQRHTNRRLSNAANKKRSRRDSNSNGGGEHKQSSRNIKADRHWKKKRKGKKSGFKCRWVKITYPVIDDCYCSC